MATPTDDTELTPQQRRFVEEYIKDLNATQAAIRAGYGEAGAHVQGHRVLSNVKVAEEIAKKKAEITKKNELTTEKVLAELKLLAFSRMKNVADWGKFGVQFRGSEDIPDDVDAAISEISSDVTHTKQGPIVKQRIKLHDKKGALELLGRYLDMWKDGPKGPAGGGISGNLSDEEIARMARAARNGLMKRNEPSE